MANKHVFSTFCLKAAATLALLALFSPLMRAQVQLSYFKNYFVTGDYAVGGVGLANVPPAVSGSTITVADSINFSGVPCTSGPGLLSGVIPCTAKGAQPADVIAAFLYWQTIEGAQTPNSANGTFNGTANTFTGIALGNPTVAACNATAQSPTYAHVYRADVLRFLPINNTANVYVANGTQTFTLSSSSAATQFVGASLVVVYRMVTPGNPRIAPLRSVVIYDGAFTGTASAGLNQTMGGFYQASLDPDASMTQIVGNGQRGLHETLTVNGGIPDDVGHDPFVGAQGANWDNYTFNYNLAPNASSVETSVVLNRDCLSWAAIVTSTNVQDTDHDGLLDTWERSGLNFDPGVRYDGVVPAAPPAPAPAPAAFGTCQDYPNTCINLPAMGANPLVPDIFMQVDWMYNLNGTYNPDGTYNPPHSHNPQIAALNMVGAVFKAHGINLHVDIGRDNSPYCQAPNSTTIGQCNYQSQNSPYIVPAAYAQGGNAVDESGSLLCPNETTQSGSCAFPSQSDLYSVLGWKFGFDAIRDGDPVLGLPQLFSQNRKDSFHYALFGHAIAATTPLSTPEAGSISGVADHPGGDILVTLGLWRSDIPTVDQVGTLLDQAGTLMHELGHNLGLSHGGWRDTPTCMPDYPSVMNYLYQVAGLTDAAGNEHIDYSYGLLLPMNEDFLFNQIPMGLQTYRVRYFGPLNTNASSPLANTPGQASKAYCSGGYPTAAGEPYVRLEWPSISTPDWSNGTVASGTRLPPLDINYDGTSGNPSANPPVPPQIFTNESFTDSPDWLSVNLQQVSARANADGFSSNLGLSQIGLSQIGLSQIGLSQIGLSQIGLSQIGLSQIGVSDAGTSALGQDALGDQDYSGFVLSGGVTPPTGLTASVTTSNDPNSGWTSTQYPGGTGNYLTWTPYTGAQASSYNIYRCNATNGACTPTAFSSASGSTSTPSFTDYVNDFVDGPASANCNTQTCYNTNYTYYVTEVVQINGISTESGKSNTVTSEVTHMFVLSNAQTVTYGATPLPFPAPAYTGYSNTSPTTSVTGVSCVYLSPSTAPRNAGTYTESCTGPSVIPSTTEGITYNTPYLTYTQGTLIINQLPITVTASASNKVYNASTNSTSIPAITTGALAYNDTNGFIETYDNPNVGHTHVMTPGGAVNDGNGGNNYTVTPVTISTGIITTAPLTISAITNTKPYDTTTSAAGVPTPSGLQGSDSVTGLVETYNTSNAGHGLTLTVSPGYTINDGNGGNNYNVTLATNTTGVINPLGITASITAANKNYDTTTAATILTCTPVGVLTPDVTNVTCAASAANFANANAGTWAVTATVMLGGSAAPNYTLPVPPTASTSATINPAPLTVTFSSMLQTYAGVPLAPTVTTSPTPNIAVTLTGAPATAAGSYPVGAMVSNPNYTGSASGIFVISPFPLTVTATGVNKNFDGTTNATVTFSDNSFAIDAGQFTYNYTANFANIGPGQSIPVNITNLALTGPASGNYSIGTVNGVAYSSGGPFTASANIADTITLSTLSLNGTNYGNSTPAPPVWTGSALQLANTTKETTSAWLGAAIPVSSAFTTSFQFQIAPPSTGPNSIGDGFAFVIQNAQNGNATLGTTAYGMYIGYAGIANSIAVEFDTYDNSQYQDPAAPHIAIQSLGQNANSPDHTPATGAVRAGPVIAGFADGKTHTATITYDGSSTLSVYLDGATTPIVSAPVNLSTLLNLSGGTSAYVGFTAASGSAEETSDIFTWTWN